MAFINIGFGNLVQSDKILAIVSPDSAPVKRMIASTREDESLIDATQGRRTKSVIICDGSRIVLSALAAETLLLRLKNTQDCLVSADSGIQ